MPRFLRIVLSVALGTVCALLLVGGIAVLLQGNPAQLVTITVSLAGLWGARKLWTPKASRQPEPPGPRSSPSHPSAHPEAYLTAQPQSKTYPFQDDWNLPPRPIQEPPVPVSPEALNERLPTLSAGNPGSYLAGDVTPTTLSDTTFVALDVETANQSRASMCAVGIAHVVDGNVVRQRAWLVQPPEPHNTFHPRNIDIHGITPSLVQSHGRPWPQVLPELINEIGGATVVAHNARFDMSVLRSTTQACGLPIPQMHYADSLDLARQVLPDLPDHRLPTVAQACDVPQIAHHDAGDDARVCAQITAHLLKQEFAEDTVRHRVNEAARSSDTAPPASGRNTDGGTSHDDVPNVDPPHPLYAAVIVITGTLSTMTRKTAQEHIAAVGAVARTTVTQKTTHLVQGRPSGRETTSLGGEKVLKALAMQQDGHPIRIITEDQFLALLKG